MIHKLKLVNKDKQYEGTCDLCKEPHNKFIRFGNELDYDGDWMDICKKCLKEITLPIN